MRNAFNQFSKVLDQDLAVIQHFKNKLFYIFFIFFLFFACNDAEMRENLQKNVKKQDLYQQNRCKASIP